MAKEEEGQERTKSHNLVASTPPLYVSDGLQYASTYGATAGTETALILDTTAVGFESPMGGESQGWNFELTVSVSTLQGFFYTRDQFFLTGLYDQEKILYPVGNNIQTAEPPLMQSRNSATKYIREVELWTTQKLTESEIRKAVHYSIPILPGFLSSDLGPDAYLDSEQLIAGRSRVYSGNAAFTEELGFMTLVHDAVIGEGEPIACPDLHYVRAFYNYAEFSYTPNWRVCDWPSARDILSVVELKAKDDRQWMTQVIRGAALDVN